MNALFGLAIVAAHAALFALYVPSCRRPELELEVPANLIGGNGGTLPLGMQPSRITAAGTTPGLRYVQYAFDYRGGFTRTVGAASLVGPFQDPAKPECTGRVVVGQRLLDNGAAGPGTIAHEVATAIAGELSGESYFGIGAFERVDKVTLRWAELVNHVDDLPMIVGAPYGYVRVTATLVFDRIAVPLVVALVPEPSANQLAFRVAARAELEFDNGALQWVSDKLGGDKLATKLARRQIDGSLLTALAPPPPFELPDGHRLSFLYCDGPPAIVEGASGALPFAVAIGRVGTTQILPPRRGRAAHAPLAANGALAIDLDFDAANALLFELWRTGFLDRRLADAGIDRRFNDDPIVAEYLSIRISSPVLALPPVLGVSRGKLGLFADARVAIRDGATATVGRVWAGLDFAFAGAGGAAVDLGSLELSCERAPTTLVPCYADLVAALRDRRADFRGALTGTFAKLLDDVFVGQRVGASGLTADLAIRGVASTVKLEPDNGSLHLELDAVLSPKR